eukprot:7070015-Alexandrium_andersonii.AAC.1
MPCQFSDARARAEQARPSGSASDKRHAGKRGHGAHTSAGCLPPRRSEPVRGARGDPESARTAGTGPAEGGRGGPDRFRAPSTHRKMRGCAGVRRGRGPRAVSALAEAPRA